MFLLLVLPRAARTQVPNDDIENRRVLQLEETVTSHTAGCTVQRACVDEGLTGKCIKYHNDQWFAFTPPAPGRYFVNIGGQQCRDVRGVQLVVLTGQPCRPETYRILSCSSLGTQDDIFVTLDSLRVGRPYLLCVDGYLEDNCEFTLQVSRTAAGMPVSYWPPTPTRVRATGQVVELSWVLPDSLLAAPASRVLRREVHAYRSTEVARVPVRRDTYGHPVTAYAITDTLPSPGTYDYQIVTVPAEPGPGAVRLRQWWLGYGTAAALPPLMAGPTPAADVLALPLAKYPRRARLSVVVTDAATGRVLLARQLVNQPKNARQGWLPTAQWQAAGIRNVAVRIICHPRRGHFFTDELLFTVPPAAGP